MKSMANSQKEFKMNGNNQDDLSLFLKEPESILIKILPKEKASEIIKVLPMYPSRT